MSRQLHCRDTHKISLWSVEYILNQSTANFGWISNSIEISFVGQAPDQCQYLSNMDVFSYSLTKLWVRYLQVACSNLSKWMVCGLLGRHTLLLTLPKLTDQGTSWWTRLRSSGKILFFPCGGFIDGTIFSFSLVEIHTQGSVWPSCVHAL